MSSQNTRKMIKPEEILSAVRKMSAVAEEEEILFEEVGAAGVITLNRPKALNSLTENMVVKMADKMREWQSSKRLVLVKG